MCATLSSDIYSGGGKSKYDPTCLVTIRKCTSSISLLNSRSKFSMSIGLAFGYVNNISLYALTKTILVVREIKRLLVKTDGDSRMNFLRFLMNLRNDSGDMGFSELIFVWK